LLAAEADVNAAPTAGDFAGATALHLAVFNGYAEVVKLLLAAEADVNAAPTAGDFAGATALYFAAKKGRVEVVKELLNKGAYANGNTKNTPLVGAVQNNHIDVVYLLVKACDLVTMKTALSYARTDIIRKIIQARITLDKAFTYCKNNIQAYQRDLVLLAEEANNEDKIKMLKSLQESWNKRLYSIKSRFDAYVYKLIKEQALHGDELCQRILLSCLDDLVSFRDRWFNEAKEYREKELSNKPNGK